MSAITAKASRKMKKYAVLTREPRCFLGSFDFSWEQRKLSELTSMHARIGWQNLRTSEFLDSGNYMLITGTDFNDGAINFSTCHYVERERYEQDRNIQIHNGSILITKDGTLGKVAYVQGLSMPATLNAGVFNVQIKDANNVDEKYLFQYLKAPFLMDYVDKKATGGTIKHLNQSILVDFPVILPQRSEQTLIGAFFQQLDNLITLHQRKCALLFSPFQALISMMFTTSTFSWEQRKLGDIADIVGGGTPSTGNQSYWDGDIDWYAPAEIADQIYANSSQKKITGLGYENSSAKMLPPGTVLFTSRAGIGKTAILTRKGCTNQGFQSIVPNRGELDSYFIFSRTEELKRYGELVGAGSTFVEVSGKQMAVMELMMPPTMREQQTIGGFFQQLDNLITLHQRKCISFTGRAGRLISTVNKKRITSSWEQRKLGEIGSVSMCRRIFKEQTSETGDIPFYKIGTFGAEPDAFISRELFEEYKSKYPYPKKGDILISASGSIGRTVEFAGNNEYFQDSNIVWLSHDERLSNSFLKCFYSVVKWAGIEGSTIKRLYNDNILNTVICMPSVPEQEHIGLFFENLDNLITLHQRKPFLMKWRNSDANRNQTNRLVL